MIELTFTRDEFLAGLNRRATDAKAANNMPEAVSLLRQAKAREGHNYQDTKLALYLQGAGLFDEAMSEFQWLLDQVAPQCENQVSPQSDNVKKSRMAHMRGKIYDKMRLASKREGRADLEQQYQVLFEQSQQVVEQLEPILEKERRDERLAWVARRMQRPR